MRTLGIIPARAGSTRVPNKNLRLVGGKPLVQRVIEAALGARELTVTAVSSDSDAVLRIAESYADIVALRRPPELATDRSPAIDYVRHALKHLDDAAYPFDAVAIMQPSSPLTLPVDIDATIRKLADTGAASAASVVEVSHTLNPVKLKRLDGDVLLPYLEEERGRTAAGNLPRVFVRNGSVYVAARATVDAGLVIADDCRAHVMPAERSVDINEPFDLAFAEFLCQRSPPPS